MTNVDASFFFFACFGFHTLFVWDWVYLLYSISCEIKKKISNWKRCFGVLLRKLEELMFGKKNTILFFPLSRWEKSKVQKPTTGSSEIKLLKWCVVHSRGLLRRDASLNSTTLLITQFSIAGVSSSVPEWIKQVVPDKYLSRWSVSSTASTWEEKLKGQ